MRATAAAFDWDCCFMANLMGLALGRIHCEAIRKSLTDTDWDVDQLGQLLAQTQHPRDVSATWRRVVAGERALVLLWLRGEYDESDTDGPDLPIVMRLPSVKKTLLDHMAAFQRMGEQGLAGLAVRVDNLEQSVLRPVTGHYRDLFAGLVLPGMTLTARAYEREEVGRRLTRTALGVKRYRTVEGRWPAQLDDLVAVGLTSADWTALEAGPMGYKLDGDDAIVWAYDPDDSDSPARVRPEPPSRADVGGDRWLWHVTRIRHGMRAGANGTPSKK